MEEERTSIAGANSKLGFFRFLTEHQLDGDPSPPHFLIEPNADDPLL
jgi:hypothetical protein